MTSARAYVRLHFFLNRLCGPCIWFCLAQFYSIVRLIIAITVITLGNIIVIILLTIIIAIAIMTIVVVSIHGHRYC